MIPRPTDDSLLSAYLDGEVTFDERQYVEERLKHDASWQDLLLELRALRANIACLQVPPIPRPSNQIWSTLAKEEQNVAPELVPASKASLSELMKPKRWLAWAAMAASMLIAFSSAAYWISRQKDDQLVSSKSIDKDTPRDNQARPERLSMESSASQKSIIEPPIPATAAERETSASEIRRELPASDEALLERAAPASGQAPWPAPEKASRPTRPRSPQRSSGPSLEKLDRERLPTLQLQKGKIPIDSLSAPGDGKAALNFDRLFQRISTGDPQNHVWFWDGQIILAADTPSGATDTAEMNPQDSSLNIPEESTNELIFPRSAWPAVSQWLEKKGISIDRDQAIPSHGDWIRIVICTSH